MIKCVLSFNATVKGFYEYNSTDWRSVYQTVLTSSLLRPYETNCGALKTGKCILCLQYDLIHTNMWLLFPFTHLTDENLFEAVI